jgi:molybdenum cofactor biosynthesis protein B
VTTDSRTDADDATTPLVSSQVVASGHRLVETRRVANDVARLRAVAEELLSHDRVDVLVASGGTGFSPRDVSVEALRPLIDREAPGFGEIFRRLSFDDIGAAALLSRAFAGSVGVRCLFVLPGNPAAVELALRQLILPTTAHWIGQLRKGAV